MSIEIVCGLLAMRHVYYKLMDILVGKRTSAIETCDVIQLDQFFRWIEGQKWKVRNKTC